MDLPDLRPLSFGELLDRTFSYYRKHFWLFVGIMALPQVLIVALNILVAILQSIIAPPSRPTVGPRVSAGFAVSTLIGIVIVFGAYFVLYALALGATTFAVSEIHLGRSSTIHGAFRSLRGRFWRIMDLMLTIGIRLFLIAFLVFMLAAVAVPGLAALAGGIAGAVVGTLLLGLALIGAGVLVVYMFLRYGCAVPALVLENLKAKDAIKRSIALTKGNLGRVFLVLLLMTLVSWTVAVLCQGPFIAAGMIVAVKTHAPLPLWLSIPSNIAGGIGGALAGPLLMLGVVLLYYDIRVRKEGFDLQVMMSALDAHAPHPAALPGVRADTPPQLEKTSVVTVILLTVVSFGLYYPIWFLRRKSALNALRSSEKLGSAMPAAVLLIYLSEFVLGFLDSARQNYGSPLNPNAFESVMEFGTLAAALMLLGLAFKVRRILEDHLTASHTGLFAQSLALQQGSSLSGVATFFFGIFYLQYKINEFVELWSQPPSSAAQEAIPAI